MTIIVDTKYGKVQGYSENGIKIFKGIPFASPPIGKLRFMPPTTLNPWDGVLDATKFGPDVPQSKSVLDAFIGMKNRKDEDSLYLNVWTPEIDNEKRPVMVWIHGGGFTNGGGARDVYNGLFLAQRGNLVIVTINYRLGALGYLYIPEITANAGQLDQIAALEWVRDNIEAFGGDPNHVTIFGESAGGVAVSTLLTMPGAKGLFNRVIAQSGTCHPKASDPRASKRGSKRLMRDLGIKYGDIEALQQVQIKDMLKVQTKIIMSGGLIGAPSPFWPVIDGDTLPEHPLDTIKKGEVKDIELLIGTNLDEAKLWGALDPSRANWDDKQLQNQLRAAMSYIGQDEQKAKEIIQVYKDAREGQLSTAPSDIADAIYTDFLFRVSAIRVAEAYCNFNPNTYSYLFTRPAIAFNGKLGSCHAVEIPYVFGTFNTSKIAVLTGKGPDLEAVSNKMMDTWIAFARTGNPNHDGIPQWPAYNIDNRATMVMDKEFKVVNSPFDKERAVWDGIF